MKVTILGCGASTGVPMIGNDWGDCNPAEPRNIRTRSSILIEHAGRAILVDAGPDLRAQLLTAGTRHLDAVVFTHEHADHTQGVDDLRSFFQMSGRPLPVYGTVDTIGSIRQRFGYMFDETKEGVARGFLSAHAIGDDEGVPELGISTFAQKHLYWTSLGLRIGSFAYSTDVKEMPEAAFGNLESLDTWVVAALRRQPHPAHAALDVILGWIGRVAPKRSYLTHMNPSMDYRTLLDELPSGIEPAYDGLVIELED